MLPSQGIRIAKPRGRTTEHVISHARVCGCMGQKDSSHGNTATKFRPSIHDARCHRTLSSARRADEGHRDPECAEVAADDDPVGFRDLRNPRRLINRGRLPHSIEFRRDCEPMQSEYNGIGCEVSDQFWQVGATYLRSTHKDDDLLFTNSSRRLPEMVLYLPFEAFDGVPTATIIGKPLVNEG